MAAVPHNVCSPRLLTVDALSYVAAPVSCSSLGSMADMSGWSVIHLSV